MPYHVMIWPKSPEQQKLSEFYAMNLSEDELRDRIIGPYNVGTPITWGGRTLPAGDIAYINIACTATAVNAPSHKYYDVIKAGDDVTNTWITGPPGDPTQSPIPALARAGDSKDPKRVMVVHGRNLGARDAMFTFLRALGLAPIEWEQAVSETGMGSPHTFDAVRAAMECAQAVVVVLTAEDRAGLIPTLAAPDDDDVALRGQPRQNVILEAGLAMGVDRERTILVEIGPIRRASDFEGLNTVRITNAPQTRAALRSRLETAGCSIDVDPVDWMNPAAGGDFEGCVVPWQAHPVPPEEASSGPGVGVGLATHELRSEGAELQLREWHADPTTVGEIECGVTLPNGDVVWCHVVPAPAGGPWYESRVSYPTDFEGATGVAAGSYAVTWQTASNLDDDIKEIARDEFRFP